jgi:methionyl-tRNA synthetase
MDEAKPSTDSTTATPAAAAPAPAPQKPTEAPADNLITIDYFSKVQLRVAQIVSAERVEGSEKLVKLKVDVGEPAGPRQILAGIAKHYVPDDLIGRKIIIVANLKPAKLMGQLSEGMLLAASDNAGNLELLSPGSVVAPGSIVR